ncbi:MAG: cupin domain-containing protein [Betaproteobacteria bacterium]|nr:cupin domain-containing protein [Betaproteobacteria bacterium]
MLVDNWKNSVPFVAPEKSDALLECDDAVVKCLHIDPGEQAKPHSHQNTVDIMVIVQGRGTATIDGKERPVGPGDVILNPRGTLHGIRNDGSERIVWLVVQSPPPGRAPKARDGTQPPATYRAG